MTTENDSALALLPDKSEFTERMKEIAFEIWLFSADRNAKRTAQILENELEEVAPGLAGNFSRFPSIRTIQHWAKTENWAQKGNDRIRAVAKFIDEEQISRLLLVSNKAIQFADALFSGELDRQSAQLLAVKATVMKEMLQFRGLGTAGLQGAPTLEVKILNNGVDTTAMSIDEKMEAFRSDMLSEKKLKKLTGH